jgi:hypothetical protein
MYIELMEHVGSAAIHRAKAGFPKASDYSEERFEYADIQVNLIMCALRGVK